MIKMFTRSLKRTSKLEDVNPRTIGCDKKMRQENEKVFNRLSCRAGVLCHQNHTSALGDKNLSQLRQEKCDTTSD